MEGQGLSLLQSRRMQRVQEAADMQRVQDLDEQGNTNAESISGMGRETSMTLLEDEAFAMDSTFFSRRTLVSNESKSSRPRSTREGWNRPLSVGSEGGEHVLRRVQANNIVMITRPEHMHSGIRTSLPEIQGRLPVGMVAGLPPKFFLDKSDGYLLPPVPQIPKHGQDILKNLKKSRIPLAIEDLGSNGYAEARTRDDANVKDGETFRRPKFQSEPDVQRESSSSSIASFSRKFGEDFKSDDPLHTMKTGEDAVWHFLRKRREEAALRLHHSGTTAAAVDDADSGNQSEDLNVVFFNLEERSHMLSKLTYDPYSLRAVRQEDCHERHFAISARGVIEIIPGEPSELSSLESWLEERKLFYFLCSIPFFKYFGLRKAYHSWRANVRRVRNLRARRALKQQLLQLDPEFQDIIRDILASFASLMQENLWTWDEEKGWMLTVSEQEAEIIGSSESLRSSLETKFSKIDALCSGIQRIIDNGAKALSTMGENRHDAIKKISEKTTIESILQNAQSKRNDWRTASISKTREHKIETENEERYCRNRLNTLHRVIRVVDVGIVSRTICIGANEYELLLENFRMSRARLRMVVVTLNLVEGQATPKMSPTEDEIKECLTRLPYHLRKSLASLSFLPMKSEITQYMARNNDQSKHRVGDYERTLASVIPAEYFEDSAKSMIEEDFKTTLSAEPLKSILEFGPVFDFLGHWEMQLGGVEQLLSGEFLSGLTITRDWYNALYNSTCTTCSGLIEIDITGVKNEFLPKATKQMTSMKSALKLMFNSQCNDFSRMLEEFILVLNKRPTEVENFAEYLSFSLLHKTGGSSEAAVHDKIYKLNVLHKALLVEDYSMKDCSDKELLKLSSADDEMTTTIADEREAPSERESLVLLWKMQLDMYTKYLKAFNDSELYIASSNDHVTLHLARCVKTIRTELVDIIKKCEITEEVSPRIGAEESVKLIEDTSKLLKEVRERTHECFRLQELFQHSQALELISILSLAEEIVASRKKFWAGISQWQRFLHNLLQEILLPLEGRNIDCTIFGREVSRVEVALTSLNISVPHRSELDEYSMTNLADASKHIASLRDDLANWRHMLPNLRLLCDPILKERHWKILLTVVDCDDPWNGEAGEAITVQKLQNYGILNKSETILSTWHAASHEAQLLNRLNEIKKDIDEIQFQFSEALINDVVYVENIDAIITTLDTTQSELAILSNSPHIGGVQEEIAQVLETLIFMQESVQNLRECTNLWLFLCRTFFAKDTNKDHYLSAASQIVGVHEAFHHIMTLAESSKWLVASIGPDGPLQACESLLVKFRSVIHIMSEDLECVREEFPRFYFVSDADLVQSICCESVEQTNPNVVKICFPGLQWFRTEHRSGELCITEIYSPSNEQIELLASVPAGPQRSLGFWMQKLVESIQITLLDQTKHALRTCATLSAIDWIVTAPKQSIFIVDQIVFTNSVEEAINENTTVDRSSIRGLSSRCKKRIGNLIKEYKTLDPNLPSTNAKRCFEMLLNSGLMQRDICSSLIDDGVLSIEDYGWKKYFRYYWDEDVDYCRVSFGESSGMYGFEYYGDMPLGSLMIPPNHSSALSVGHVFETENVFELLGSPSPSYINTLSHTVAAASGHHSYSSTASEMTQKDLVYKLIIGAVKSGSWVFMSNVKALGEEVIATLSQALCDIRSQIQYKSDAPITINGKTFRPAPSWRFFFSYSESSNHLDTRELQRTSRSNMKWLSQSIRLGNVEERLIIESLMITSGLKYDPLLNRKTYCCLEALKILVLEYTEVILYPSDLLDIKGLIAQNLEDLNAQEGLLSVDEVVASSIHDLMADKLGQNTKVMEKVRDVIKVCFDHDFSNHESQQPPDQLYRLLKARDGCILLGKRGSGKSHTLKEVMKTVKPRNVSRLYCGSMTSEIFIGAYESKEWVPGAFTRALKRNTSVKPTNLQFIEDRKLKSRMKTFRREYFCEIKQPAFVLLDGPIPDGCADIVLASLNGTIPLLSEKQTILKESNVKIVWETDKLSGVTPSFVCDFGILHVTTPTTLLRIYRDDIKKKFDGTFPLLTGLFDEIIHKMIYIFPELSIDDPGIISTTKGDEAYTLQKAILSTFMSIISKYDNMLIMTESEETSSSTAATTERLQRHFERCFVFSMLASVRIMQKHNYEYAESIIYQHFPEATEDLGRESYGNYVPAGYEGGWMNVSDSAIVKPLHENRFMTGRDSLIVPTPSMAFSYYLLSHFCKHSLSVVLTGPSYASKALSRLAGIELTDGQNGGTLSYHPLSTTCKAQHVQWSLMSKMFFQQRTVLKPLLGKRMLMCIDDLHIQYSSQAEKKDSSVSEWLRQCLEKNTIYHSSSHETCDIGKVSFVIAVDKNAEIKDQRLARHLQTVVCDYEESPEYVYQFFVSTCRQFEAITGSHLSDSILRCLVLLEQKVQNADIRLSIGDGVNINGESVFDLTTIWRILHGTALFCGADNNLGFSINEIVHYQCYRQYVEAQVSNRSLLPTAQLVNDFLDEYFEAKTNRDNYTRAIPIPNKNSWERGTVEAIQERLGTQLQTISESGEWDSLLPHDELLDVLNHWYAPRQIARLSEILMGHEAHPFVIGESQHVNRGIISLSCLLSGYKCIEVCGNPFDTLEKAMDVALTSQVALIMTDTSDHRDLLRMLDLMCRWSRSELFSQPFSSFGQRSSSELQQLWGKIKIVVAASKQNYFKALESFPSLRLYSNLIRIDRNFYNEIEDHCASTLESVSLSTIISLEEPRKQQSASTLASGLVRIHRVVAESDMMSISGEAISYEHIIDCMNLMMTFVGERRRSLANKNATLKVSLQKLIAAEEELEAAKETVSKIDPVLAVITSDINKIMVKIAAAEMDIDKGRIEVLNLTERLRKTKQFIEAKRLENNEKYDCIVAEYERSVAGALNVAKEDINELRSFSQPPGLVKIVMEAVCLLMEMPQTWESAVMLLADNSTELMNKIQQFDKDRVKKRTYKRLCMLIKNPNFKESAVEQVSKAAKTMCTWVLALANYVSQHVIIRDDLERVREAEGKCKTLKAQVKEAKSKLSKTNTVFDIFMNDHKEALDKKKFLEKQRQKKLDEIQQIETLVELLESQKPSWKQQIEEVGDAVDTLFGHALLSAAAVVYLGPYSFDERLALVSSWVSNLNEVGIKVHEDFVERRVDIYLEHHQKSKAIRGLDLLPTILESFIISTQIREGQRYIISDPDGVGATALSNFYRTRQIKVISAVERNVMETIKNIRTHDELLVILRIDGSIPYEFVDRILNYLSGRNSEVIMLSTRTEFRDTEFAGKGNKFINFSLRGEVLDELFIQKQLQIFDEKAYRLLMDSKKRLEESRNAVSNMQMRVTTLVSNTIGNLSEDPDVINSLVDDIRTLKTRENSVRKALSDIEGLEPLKLRYEEASQLATLIFHTMQEKDNAYFISFSHFMANFEACTLVLRGVQAPVEDKRHEEYIKSEGEIKKTRQGINTVDEIRRKSSSTGSRPGTPRSRPSTPRSRPSTPRSRPGTPRSRPGTPRSRPGTPRSNTRPSSPFAPSRPSSPFGRSRPETPERSRPSSPRLLRRESFLFLDRRPSLDGLTDDFEESAKVIMTLYRGRIEVDPETLIRLLVGSILMRLSKGHRLVFNLMISSYKLLELGEITEEEVEYMKVAVAGALQYTSDEVTPRFDAEIMSRRCQDLTAQYPLQDVRLQFADVEHDVSESLEEWQYCFEVEDPMEMFPEQWRYKLEPFNKTILMIKAAPERLASIAPWLMVETFRFGDDVPTANLTIALYTAAKDLSKLSDAISAQIDPVTYILPRSEMRKPIILHSRQSSESISAIFRIANTCGRTLKAGLKLFYLDCHSRESLEEAFIPEMRTGQWIVLIGLQPSGPKYNAVLRLIQDLALSSKDTINTQVHVIIPTSTALLGLFPSDLLSLSVTIAISPPDSLCEATLQGFQAVGPLAQVPEIPTIIQRAGAYRSVAMDCLIATSMLSLYRRLMSHGRITAETHVGSLQSGLEYLLSFYGFESSIMADKESAVRDSLSIEDPNDPENHNPSEPIGPFAIPAAAFADITERTPFGSGIFLEEDILRLAKALVHMIHFSTLSGTRETTDEATRLFMQLLGWSSAQPDLVAFKLEKGYNAMEGNGDDILNVDEMLYTLLPMGIADNRMLVIEPSLGLFRDREELNLACEAMLKQANSDLLNVSSEKWCQDFTLCLKKLDYDASQVILDMQEEFDVTDPDDVLQGTYNELKKVKEVLCIMIESLESRQVSGADYLSTPAFSALGHDLGDKLKDWERVNGWIDGARTLINGLIEMVQIRKPIGRKKKAKERSPTGIFNPNTLAAVTFLREKRKAGPDKSVEEVLHSVALKVGNSSLLSLA